MELLKTSCQHQEGTPENNSKEEIGYIRKAVESVSDSSHIDPRFIFAIIIQESKGCVRIKTSQNVIAGFTNPGLMQSHGEANCVGVAKCPEDTILKMIREGTEGVGGEKHGLSGFLKKAVEQLGKDANDAQTIYLTSRFYNSGSHPQGVPLETAAKGTTSCYASDVANRLMGWAGAQTECTVPNP